MAESQNNIHTWHEGELAVQERAGTLELASRLTRGIRTFIPEAAQGFVAEQRFAVLAWTDGEGRIWASPRTGAEGFLRTPDARSLEVGGESPDSELMNAALRADPKLGVLVIEFARRRRMRLNGKASVLPSGSIVVQTSEVYSNCPQYIQARSVKGELSSELSGAAVESGDRLLAPHRQFIEKADTLFIASMHPEHGADASHRGGNPGFVKVVDERTLWIPDYSGNNMFNTLGNIQSNPSAGLLFVDFETGRTLQLSGTASIVWDRKMFFDMPGAARMIEFKVRRVRESQHGIRLRYQFESYSSVNPKRR